VQLAFVSGCAVSATLLGEPDVGLLTPPEMARKCNQIAASNPGLSIIADADTGGGNSLNVQRTVRQLISNGCKGCVLEDQMWPKKSGHIREKSVETMEEFAAKVSAARAAIGDSDFFLIARTVCFPPPGGFCPPVVTILDEWPSNYPSTAHPMPVSAGCSRHICQAWAS
jgi:2-methylisocitrate lyase-like PEP mutase family enzyme